jgi:hypothetical protein
MNTYTNLEQKEIVEAKIETLKEDLAILIEEYESKKTSLPDIYYALERMRNNVKMLNRYFGFTHEVNKSVQSIPFHDSSLITYSDER